MAEASGRSIADRINFLFETVRPEGQNRPYTNAEVARGTGLGKSHIGYLRSGERSPGVEALRVLAEFFGVQPSYLIDSDPTTVADIESQVKLASLLANEPVHILAMRLLDANPSAQALDAIRAMIDQVLLLDAQAAKARKQDR